MLAFIEPSSIVICQEVSELQALKSAMAHKLIFLHFDLLV
jgi:hypothetical protein